MEVKFDPSIKNAYRHSSSSQPLHTDGSYVPEYPNSTLMCCKVNKTLGGETTFVESKKLLNLIKKKNKKLFDFLTTKKIIHERSGSIKVKKFLTK